jgi:hypothetical protein
MTTLVYYITYATGGMIGSRLPALLNPLLINETLTYRFLLSGASLLVLLGSLPMLFC